MQTYTLEQTYPQLVVGPKLRFFPPAPQPQWDEVVRVFDNNYDDPLFKGEAREDHANFLLSLFNIQVIPVVKGSQLDLDGVDIILRTGEGDLLVQVKSSAYGVSQFINKRPQLAKRIILLWLDTKSISSRKKLFLLLVPVLQAKGIDLKLEVREAIHLKQELVKKGIYSLQAKGISPVATEKLNLLTRIGLIKYKGDSTGGTYVL